MKDENGRVGELIIEIACEGGGETIYGSKSNGLWGFWSEGSSLSLDETDDEEIKSWQKPETSDLASLLCEEWFLLSALTIHPEFLDWFRSAYERETAALSPEAAARYGESRRQRWNQVLRR